MNLIYSTLLLLVVGTQGIQFQPPAVVAIVSEVQDKYSEYIKYNGTPAAAPVISAADTEASILPRQSTSYWYENINHQGISAFGPSGYTVYRNVKNYGAKGTSLMRLPFQPLHTKYRIGDGVTDDTAAINSAISAGGRCGRGCSSSTTTPAVVYFPAGTYLISSSIVDYYYTQLIGNPNSPPVLKATSSFSGFGLIDGDPYYTSNLNWGSTNVFYRQVRNFVFDLTSIPATSQATGIHWPTAQATSLQNVVFEMSSAAGTQHTGLFCESGKSSHLPHVLFLLIISRICWIHHRCHVQWRNRRCFNRQPTVHYAQPRLQQLRYSHQPALGLGLGVSRNQHQQLSKRNRHLSRRIQCPERRVRHTDRQHHHQYPNRYHHRLHLILFPRHSRESDHRKRSPQQRPHSHPTNRRLNRPRRHHRIHNHRRLGRRPRIHPLRPTPIRRPHQSQQPSRIPPQRKQILHAIQAPIRQPPPLLHPKRAKQRLRRKRCSRRYLRYPAISQQCRGCWGRCVLRCRYLSCYEHDYYSCGL